VVTVHLHPGGPEFNNIFPLMQDRAGGIWAGSGGLARLIEGRFENVYAEGTRREPWVGLNTLCSLAEDRDGSFWLGTKAGIARFRDGRLWRDEAMSIRMASCRWYNPFSLPTRLCRPAAGLEDPLDGAREDLRRSCGRSSCSGRPRKCSHSFPLIIRGKPVLFPRSHEDAGMPVCGLWEPRVPPWAHGWGA